jgi:hypothetical protein
MHERAGLALYRRLMPTPTGEPSIGGIERHTNKFVDDVS